MRRAGIQTEILLSLGLVMVLATLVLAGVAAAHREAGLRRVLGSALLAEARRPPEATAPGVMPGTAWWVVDARGEARSRGSGAAPLDPETRRLGEEAVQQGASLLRPGALWDPIRFAAPGRRPGEAVVARLPAEASWELRGAPLAVLAVVLAVDAVVFTALGAALLRRRVVQPLQRLGEAARAIAGGAEGVRAAEEGARETADVARSMNEMHEALARRSDSLRKAVVELRAANADLRSARAVLDRNERLAAVGQLAAGVAHEVGNPIGAMLAFLDLAGRDPDLGAATREHLARAGREGERVRRILRQLLDFSRPPRGEPAPLDLAAAAEEARALVAAQRRYERVCFELRVEGTPPAAWADAGAVTQILVNLLLNAADAAAEAEAPRVELTVRAAPSGPRRAGDPDDEAAGARRPEQVECRVADTGPGIPEEDRERIFLPFVTTKPPGEGTGLGLPNALRLAEDQGGSLEWVDPPPGSRTAFALRLPVAGPASARVREGAAP